MKEEPSRAERPRDNIPEAVKGLVELWSAAAEASSDIAHAKRTLFLAYVGEGFTESQALELVKTI